jgi:hypothetical protein
VTVAVTDRIRVILCPGLLSPLALRTTFRGLSEITGRVEDFFSKAGVEARTGVFGAVGIVGILKIAGVIIGAVETGAARGVGLEASFCARHGKTVL